MSRDVAAVDVAAVDVAALAERVREQGETLDLLDGKAVAQSESLHIAHGRIASHDEEIDALAADVARVQGAVRMLVETLTPDPGRAPSDYWPLAHGESAAILAAMAAPAPDPAPDAGKRVPSVPAGSTRVLDVDGCSACGADHFGMVFDPHPFADSWVAECPATGLTIFAKDAPTPPPPALPGPCPFCGKRPFWRVQYRDRKWHVWCFDCGANGPEADSEANALAAWARALPPALDAEARAVMLDARMAVLGYRDTIRRGSSPEASSFRDRMDALASALRAAAGPTP